MFALGVKKTSYKTKIKAKTNLYIYGIAVLSLLLLSLACMPIYILNEKSALLIVFILLEALFIFIPISEIVTKIIQNILSKCVKPKLIPKMDYSHGIPKEEKTMIVIPSILKTRRRCKKYI